MSKLTDISYIKEVMSKNGVNFSKSLGQNFLINKSICPKMAEEAVFSENVGVIEIGTGVGVLTYELAKLAKKVVAIELDKKLLPILDETLSEFDNIKIINDDVLKVDLNKLIAEEFAGMDVVVCANLPYYITSPVIMKLLEEKLSIKSIIVMVQKEAADRLCAAPGSRECGAVSLAVSYYSNPQILFKVSRGSFMPSPNVDSAVIKLDVYDTPPVDIVDEKFMFKIIKSAFSQRRKTLVNSVSSVGGIAKPVLFSALESLNIKQTVRAEELSLEQFCDLSNELLKNR